MLYMQFYQPGSIELEDAQRCVIPIPRLSKRDYSVRVIKLDDAQEMVREWHYAKGGSNTAVACHGLFRKDNPIPVGVAWWLPPTRVAAESVNYENWQRVLTLTRLVVVPGVPKNACTFLLAGARKLLRNDDPRWLTLLTYADESQGHTGAIYKADNWHYEGRTGPYARWVDSEGRQVATKSTYNRTKAEMLALGHRCIGRFYKHKYTKQQF